MRSFARFTLGESPPTAPPVQQLPRAVVLWEEGDTLPDPPAIRNAGCATGGAGKEASSFKQRGVTAVTDGAGEVQL